MHAKMGAFVHRSSTDRFAMLCDPCFLEEYFCHITTVDTAIERFVGAFIVEIGSLIKLHLVVSEQVRMEGLLPGPRYVHMHSQVYRADAPSFV